MNYSALYLSPMIPSFNLNATAGFFREVLGFSALMETESYAVYVRDGLTIHILPAGSDIGQMEFYLEVDNVDELWEEIRERVTGMKVRAPFDRDYGMREIHICIPHTNTLMFIGQVITKQ